MSRTLRWAVAPLLAGALLVAGCGAEPPRASIEPPAEQEYVDYLQRNEIVPTYGDADTAVVLGHQVCDRYDRGDSFAAVIDTLTGNGIPGYEAGQINGAATAAFCPEHAAP